MKSILFAIILVITSPGFGQTSPTKIKNHKKTTALKQEIAKQIPIGSRINDVQRIMEANGFTCVLREHSRFSDGDNSGVGQANMDFLYCHKSQGLLINTVFYRVAVVHKDGVVSELLASISKTPVLHRKDYINMSDSEIRSVLLDYVPLGSSEDDVKRVLRSAFHRGYRNDDYWVPVAHFVCRIEQGDVTLRSRLQSYNEAKNFWLAGDYVDAYWLFDKNRILKDVQVSHWWDGV